MEKTTLNIEGMHCGACATGINMLVSGMDGVKTITVDYNTKKGDLEYDPSKVTLDQVKQSIAELGYKAS